MGVNDGENGEAGDIQAQFHHGYKSPQNQSMAPTIAPQQPLCGANTHYSAAGCFL